jgi:hypothetical protein
VGGWRLRLEDAPNSPHRLAKETECEEMFLRLLDERNAQGRPVGDKNSAIYAPKVFADTDNNGGFAAQAFARAIWRGPEPWSGSAAMRS